MIGCSSCHSLLNLALNTFHFDLTISQKVEQSPVSSFATVNRFLLCICQVELSCQHYPVLPSLIATRVAHSAKVTDRASLWLLWGSCRFVPCYPECFFDLHYVSILTPWVSLQWLPTFHFQSTTSWEPIRDTLYCHSSIWASCLHYYHAVKLPLLYWNPNQPFLKWT